jgi:hypothetical protein
MLYLYSQHRKHYHCLQRPGTNITATTASIDIIIYIIITITPSMLVQPLNFIREVINSNLVRDSPGIFFSWVYSFSSGNCRQCFDYATFFKSFPIYCLSLIPQFDTKWREILTTQAQEIIEGCGARTGFHGPHLIHTYILRAP